ncbi:MAG: hypothetical protein ACO1SV_00705 [Fimbriimonas sp.]
MKVSDLGLDHDQRFALDQTRLIEAHLLSGEVDYAFIARHARTLLQIAEWAQEPVSQDPVIAGH